MPFLGILLLVVVLVGFIVAGYLSHRAELERTLAIGRVARSLGWHFHGKAENHALRRQYPAFELFQEGDDRYAHNCLEGTLPAFERTLRTEAGDYHYTTVEGAGKSRREKTHRFSYLLVELPFGPKLPSLVVRPENLFDKAVGAIGFEDIDFESAEFSRRFHVSGGDRRFAYAVIDPRMITFLLDVAPPRIELGGGVLLIVSDQGKNRWEPSEFADAIRWTQDFLARWPGYVVRDRLPSS